MGIRRSTRAGQTFRVVLLCDPTYQAKRVAAVAAAESAVHVCGGLKTVADAAGWAEVERLNAAEDLYRLSLDVSTLPFDVSDVDGAHIRGLSVDDVERIQDEATGRSIEAARAAVKASKAGAPASQAEDAAALGARERERLTRIAQAGVVSIDGDEGVARDSRGLYPLDALRGIGSRYIDVVRELAIYIQAAGDLGE